MMNKDIRESPKPPNYQVYLLRVWEEPARPEELPSSWRYSLEDPKTKDRIGFASLDELVCFLDEEHRVSAPADPADPSPAP